LEARDEGMIDEIMATERHLLYVAATRARERLWVSGAGTVSEFLEDLL
jgi:ATP-dependent exoDNAse (exonuclease V) beta subunit